MAASIKIQAQAMQDQGIMTIFGSETDRNRVFATSVTTDSPRLRRTLSADLSSKKWLSQNGFTPMKRISSSEDLSLPFEEEKKDVESSEAVWSSIQRDKNKKDQDSIWSCILSNKTNDAADDSSKCLPPPYVHPLVKRSQSSLSEKSLEICTESLGSETGSDVVTSYPPSETEEEEHDQQEHKVKVQALAENDDEKQDKDEEVEEEEICNVQKHNSLSSSTKKCFPSRSFPPPIPSIQMRSRRDEGRLVLEAVSLPSNNNFSAQRQDGRLVLTFANQQQSKHEETEETEKDQTEETEEDETEETEEEEEAEQTTMVTSNGNNITSVTLMMNNKPNSNINNGNWSEKLKNHVVNFEDVNDVVKKPRVVRLIPTSPNASFNVYEYFWRSKPNHEQNYKSSSCSLNNSSNKLIVSGMNNADLVVLRGKNGGYLVHNLKTCKDSRRSYLFWEPYCIATS